MAEKIKLVRGDTRPQLKVALKDETDGTPVDLTGATVKLYFRLSGSSTLQATVVGALLTGLELEDGTVTSAPPYNVEGAGGRVLFPWAVGDLDCEPGDYEGEIEVTFPDASKQTVYDALRFKLRGDFAD